MDTWGILSAIIVVGGIIAFLWKYFFYPMYRGYKGVEAINEIKHRNKIGDHRIEETLTTREEIGDKLVNEPVRMKPINKIVILMNRRPTSDEHLFVQEILSTMKVHGQTYTQQISQGTVIHTFSAGEMDFNDEMAVLGAYSYSAYVQIFGSPPSAESLRKITLAPFESSIGIRGNIIAEFENIQG